MTTSKQATGVKKPKGDLENAQPKILKENPPPEDIEDHGVKQHNEEMAKRADKADSSVSNEDAGKDKVRPSFWSGQQEEQKK